jgi:hypothetical protein
LRVSDVAVVGAVLFAAWPAGFLRLGYVTSYAVFGLMGSAHRSEYYGESNALALFQNLFGANPALFLCAAVAISGAAWAWWKTTAPVATVFVCYAVLTCAFNALNNFRNATYAFEATVFVWLLFVPAFDWLCGNDGQEPALNR